MNEHQLGSAATGSGGLGTDGTTVIEVMEPSLLQRLYHPNSETPRATAESSNVLVEEPVKQGRDTTSSKKEAETLEFEAWPDFRNFRIWRMNYRSEVSSCASRPIEAVVWMSEIESAKCIVDLKTPYSIIGQSSTQT